MSRRLVCLTILAWLTLRLMPPLPPPRRARAPLPERIKHPVNSRAPSAHSLRWWAYQLFVVDRAAIGTVVA